MALPEGMTTSEDQLRKISLTDAGDICLRMIKIIYRLKQAGRLWNKLLYQTLVDPGFALSVTDACVYKKATIEGTTAVRVNVDDLYLLRRAKGCSTRPAQRCKAWN